MSDGKAGVRCIHARSEQAVHGSGAITELKKHEEYKPSDLLENQVVLE